MKEDQESINAKSKEKELFEGLDKLSKRLMTGNDDSVGALYRLKELLYRTETLKLAGKINPRLLSIVWTLQKFIHDLWTNFSGGSKGIPKEEGIKVLQDIAKYTGIFIQTSLFRNRPKDSIGTLEKIIGAYYYLLQLAEKAYKNELPDDSYVVL